MSITPQQKKELVKTLVDLAINEPVVYKEILQEVMDELKLARKNKIADLIQAHFDEFDETFKALAKL